MRPDNDEGRPQGEAAHSVDDQDDNARIRQTSERGTLAGGPRVL